MANQADRIAQALQSLENHQFRSRRQAAIHFRVPLSTLCHRANGRPRRGEIDLSSQHLTNAQEEVVLQWIKDLQRQFMPPTYDQVRYIVTRLLHNFRPLGKHWITRFKARHPELETSRARAIEIQRLQGTDPMLVQAFYQEVEYHKNEYHIERQDMYNMDEKGFQLGQFQGQTVLFDKRTNPPVSSTTGFTQ